MSAFSTDSFTPPPDSPDNEAIRGIHKESKIARCISVATLIISIAIFIVSVITLLVILK